VFSALHGLIVKTVRIVGPLRRALEREPDSFAARVASQPRLFVIGSEATSAELERLGGVPANV
jgi:hypothetical protein